MLLETFTVQKPMKKLGGFFNPKLLINDWSNNPTTILLVRLVIKHLISNWN